MPLQIQSLTAAKNNLIACNTAHFKNPSESFKWFIHHLHIVRFRHIKNLSIDFSHPVTALSGCNRSGKTSALLLIACSHEKFLRPDATSSIVGVRAHGWNDVLSFTSHEAVSVDYQYKLEWRRASQKFLGVGKRLHTSRAWSGIAKKSSDGTRMNAKIRVREARLVDLERLLPARAFSDSLYRKANLAVAISLHEDIAQAFSYIFDSPVAGISEAGSHLNRRCFIITRGSSVYSTYNAASGEEAVIYLLKDLIESPPNSLILIDEIEIGIHPSVQRKLLDIIHIISWRDKKQIIFTTHSPTVLSAVDSTSRRFIDMTNDNWRCLSGISMQAASSKMDSVAHPLIQLYCEDALARFLIEKQLIDLSTIEPHTTRLVNIIPSGPANQVMNDYSRHKRNYKHLRVKLGYCAIFDGDYMEDPLYSTYHENPDEKTSFIYPYDKPEKFLVRAYLRSAHNETLEAALQHSNHHSLFDQMVQLGLAADQNDARNICYEAFKATPEYNKHSIDIKNLIQDALKHFSELPD